MQAMILAAGLGTRLRPFSLRRPKPLFPVLDKPLLQISIERLRRLGAGKITVNAHHLAEQFADFLSSEQDVFLQKEETVLGTGGGLRMAFPGFGRDPVLVVNGDIHHNIDLVSIYEKHCVSGAQVSLVLHDFPRFNNVAVDAENKVLAFGPEEGDENVRILAFTGIHVINPQILKKIPANTFYDIIELYRLLIAEGEVIKVIVVKDHFWTDMGTPRDYLKLHEVLLRQGVAGQNDDFARKGGFPFYLGDGVRIGHDVQMMDWVCVGSRAMIGDGASLTRVVVWDKAQVPAGAVFQDEIVI
ncbi:MAG: nucleotidyltransferase family protein [Proteobacteria bacterium]|nr:nucleotidyltransferase family protein [Pseudomonadota bacterium]MBU1714146.1 nucleotidyltransferase family protein [Pseudomonadota bacterium]